MGSLPTHLFLGTPIFSWRFQAVQFFLFREINSYSVKGSSPLMYGGLGRKLISSMKLRLHGF